jgi:hypothetical protein
MWRANVEPRRRANIERFCAAYGVGPGVYVYKDLQTTSVPDARINGPNLLFFLVSMNWLPPTRKKLRWRGSSDEKTCGSTSRNTTTPSL